MSALILFALALTSYLASGTLQNARNNLVREVAEGMTRASAVFLYTTLAACVAVFLFNVSMDTDTAAMRLRDIESGLRFAQSWRARILGSWDWRLVLGYAGIGIAGALFALEDAASRIMWGLRHVKIAGAALALLASLTISTLPAEEALRDLELRYAEARNDMASDAKAIEDLAEMQVRQTAINVIEEAVLYCNDEQGPQCPRVKALVDRMPAHRLLADDPRLSAIWEGTYAWTNTPKGDDNADARRPLVTEPFTDWRTVLAETTPRELKTRISLLVDSFPGTVDSARRALIGLAVDAGYDTAVEAARHAGASGGVVEALLMPLVAAPLKTLLERLTQDAVTRTLKGEATLTDINDHVRSRVGAAVKTAEGAAAIERAIVDAADAVGAAEASSGQALVELRQREREREQAARQNATDGGPPTLGDGFTGIQGGGPTTETGSQAPYGGQPRARMPEGRPGVVH